MEAPDILASLDLGSSKISVVVAECGEGGLDVIGIGSVPSTGLRKGVVVNIDSTVRAIRAALDQAEAMAGVEIQTVFVGVGGSHIRGFNQHGVVAIANREVQREDIERVLEQTRAVPLTADRQVLHVLAQEFIVDDQDGVREPVGMSGVRLEAKVHMITAASPSVQNLVKCTERCGLRIHEMILQPLASAEAVLSDDEKEIGVALVDIGGGTTDLVIFENGALVYTCVIPVGGINLTNDIATGLRTPLAEAERIKVRHGCAEAAYVEEDEVVEVPSVGGRAPRVIPRRVLGDIIEPRMEEILASCRHVIDETGYADMLASGVVLTGGATQIAGVNELAERVLQLPVRVGMPSGVGGLVDVVRAPGYATAVGLAQCGLKRLRGGEFWELQVDDGASGRGADWHKSGSYRAGAYRAGLERSSWSGRLGRWFRDVF